MSLSYRKATENDWELVRDLEKEAASVSPRFFLAYESEKEIKDYLQKDQVFLVMEDEQPVGTVAFNTKGQELAHIDGLAIVPSCTGKGYGTEAMRWVMDQIQNIKKAELVVHPQNSVALRIYLKVGFKIIGWKDNYFGDGEPRLELVKKEG
ncbi:GNAT family N-acetyltransferase [Candidatus Daviesbacteria bacterium]|nr:GNAT family N-acetyltransferase [Candidatus Daviesbacteria bacterium]